MERLNKSIQSMIQRKLQRHGLEQLAPKLSSAFCRQVWKRLNELATKHDIKVIPVLPVVFKSLYPAGPADRLRGVFDGYQVIYLSSKLKGWYRNWVLCHELGHAVYHTTRSRFNGAMYAHNPQYHNKKEKEADKFGLRLLYLVGKGEFKKLWSKEEE